MKQIALAVSALTVVFAGCVEQPVPGFDSRLGSSGDMISNADGTASFEFRVSNERADVVVTGFTVIVTFYDGQMRPERALGEYRWSFRSEISPKGQLLEYGVLDATAVADLRRRYAATAGVAADPLAKAVYTYSAKIDSHLPGQ